MSSLTGSHILDIYPEEFAEINLFPIPQKYRVKQLYDWLYRKMELDPTKMENLPLEYRQFLKDNFHFDLPVISRKFFSKDKTKKFLLTLADNTSIEMVLIPNKKKITLCLSSQTGCSRNCSFCATAKKGLIRNLEVNEIIAQVLISKQELQEQKLTNIVFMGMGEPLDNFDNVIKAIRIMQHNLCLSFSPRRITVSTAGIIPQIDKLADMNIKLKLAVSLNSAIQEKREILMPVSRQYPLTELKKSLLNFRKKNPFRITFEYILIRDYNMGKEDVKALLKFLGDISCKLNLIKWNKVEGTLYEAPCEAEIDDFIKSMHKLGSAITYRRTRGSDIAAACGQLAAKLEKVS